MSARAAARQRQLAQSLSGRQTRARRPGVTGVLFRPITLFALLLIGLFSFGALIVLGGFAEDLRKAPPGQATPRAVSAVGYKALLDYLNEIGFTAHETRGERTQWVRENHMVLYTPSRTGVRLKSTLKDRDGEIRLIVPPKWSVSQMKPQAGEDGRTDWARKTSKRGTVWPSGYRSLLDDMPVVRRKDGVTQNIDVSFELNTPRELPDFSQLDIRSLQYFDLDARWPDYGLELRDLRKALREAERKRRAEERGETYEPPKEDEENEDDEKADEEETKEPEPLPNHEVLMRINGNPVLIQLEDTTTFVLSDPDLLNTMAFETQTSARLALAVIDEVIYAGGAEPYHVDFDMSLHGFDENQNVIKLMVTPPFLAATLCLLAAGGLVAWQGINRFGDPARLRPDYAQGPVSLAKTAAEFMEIAGRAHTTGEEYAALIRRQVADALGLSRRTAKDTDTLLDAREKRLKLTPTYAELRAKLASADTQTYPAYARALNTWRTAMTTDDTLTGPKDIS